MSETKRTRVFLRVKPHNNECELINWLQIENKRYINHKKLYVFDYIFDEFTTQNQVFEKFAEPIVRNFIDGFNGVIFVFGPTNTGKTYTMEGNLETPGVVPQALKQIFDTLGKSLKIKFYEVYNESIIDLMNSRSTAIKVRETPEKREPQIDGISEIECCSYEESLKIYKEGNKYRSSSCTNLNIQSSRSHSIFHVTIDNSENSRHLYFVDLAGSEKLFKHTESKNTLCESVSINQSLLTFSKMIQILAVRKETYLPYRDSLLTRVLKGCLNPYSYISILCHITPLLKNESETLSTLRFAQTAINIKLYPKPLTCKNNPANNIGHYKAVPVCKKQSDSLCQILPSPTYFTCSVKKDHRHIKLTIYKLKRLRETLSQLKQASKISASFERII